MVLYAFYIFDRHSECIYRKRWNPTSTTTGPTTTSTSAGPTGVSVEPHPQTEKLIFGAVLSLRNMVMKLGGESNTFLSYRTNEYKLHFYETPTRIKFILLTDIKATLTDKQTSNLRGVLHQIWANLYVEYVVKNPLSPSEHPGGIGVTNELFDRGLDRYLENALKA